MKMTSYLENDYNHVFEELQDYMLYEKTLQRSDCFSVAIPNPLQQLFVKMGGQKVAEKGGQIFGEKSGQIFGEKSGQIFGEKSGQKTSIKPTFYKPKQFDTLFWCFHFILQKEKKQNDQQNGENNDYNDLDVNEEIDFDSVIENFQQEEFEQKQHNIVKEKQIKIEYIEKIRKNKQIIKSHKFATLSHIENQLANEAKIDIYTFFALCVLENINVLLVDKKTYYQLIVDTENPTIHIIHCLGKKYMYEHFSENKIEEYKEQLYKIENIAKPIKSLSFYKSQDLIDLCNKLSIKMEGKKLKKDYYEAIVQYFS